MTAYVFARFATDPAAFADAMLPRNEKGQPWTLTRYQRRVLARAFRRGPLGELLFRLVLWSETKKSGKTFLAGVLILWWGFTNPNTEIILAANDLEQAASRVFRTVAALIRMNPALAVSASLRATSIELSNGTLITAISSDYRGAAGSRHSLVVFDELWGFSSENGQRLYEELTPPPTEANAWVLIVTYAGFTGESTLLETMYHRGLAGTRVDDELELYEADGLFMFWSHTPRQPWQTDAYYGEQARSLRPATFARLHKNEWVVSEGSFVTADLWDDATEPTWSAASPDPDLEVYGGLDIGVKDDECAVVFVTKDEQDGLIVLVQHRLWRPSHAEPIDLEQTVEAFIREVDAQYRLERLYADPYQAHRTLTTLRRDGIRVEEFPQTPANLTRAAQGLFDLLRSQRLIVYPDVDLRQQAMNAIGIETPRGWRIGKRSGSRKVDSIVALSLAVVAALDAPVRPPLRLMNV